jgi:cold shock CspA family protein
MDEKRGTIQRYDFNRGFGFVKPAESDKDVFFHISMVAPGYEPIERDTVTFQIETAPDGRLRATNVCKVQ